MVLEPAVRAVTSPVEEFTDTAAGLLLLQVPVPPPSTKPFAVNVAIWFTHKGLVPLMEVTAALGFTVMVLVTAPALEQPNGLL